MLRTLTTVVAFVAGISSVASHAVVQTPTPRKTGSKHTELCGAAVVKKLESDITGPIENAMAKVDADYHCNAYLCRGYQYEDNKSNVRAVKAGDVIDFHVDLVAGHMPGFANVSVIDLATNKAVGQPLLTWPSWPCSDANPCNDVDFNVTIPNTLGTACAEGGKCAIQWYWLAQSKQTYESCIDFYIKS